MFIKELSTNKNYPIEIKPIESSDFKQLTKSKYHFNWKEEREFEIHKLRIKDELEILGLISFEKYPEEWRIHIRLITVSSDNKGIYKKYDRIAGNLIAFVSRLAVMEYGQLACVSLRPKNKLAKYYINKYNMNLTGATLSLEVPHIIELINQYESHE